MKCASCCPRKKNEQAASAAAAAQEDSSSGATLSCGPSVQVRSSEIPYLWFPSLQGVKQLDYVRRLESEFECLQKGFLCLTTQFARMQFRLRQILTASPCERDILLADLERIAFLGADEVDCDDELPRIQEDIRCMGDVRCKQKLIIQKLRNQLTALVDDTDELDDEIEYTMEEDKENYEYMEAANTELEPMFACARAMAPMEEPYEPGSTASMPTSSVSRPTSQQYRGSNRTPLTSSPSSVGSVSKPNVQQYMTPSRVRMSTEPQNARSSQQQQQPYQSMSSRTASPARYSQQQQQQQQTRGSMTGPVSPTGSTYRPGSQQMLPASRQPSTGYSPSQGSIKRPSSQSVVQSPIVPRQDGVFRKCFLRRSNQSAMGSPPDQPPK